MNRRSGLLAALAVTAGLLSGCARPAYDDVEMKYAALPAGQGRIYVYQPSSPGDPATGSPYVLVNGEKGGRTSPGNFFFVDRPAGRYLIKIEFSTSPPLTLELAAGQTRYIRVNKGASRLTFNEEPQDKAKTEMADLSYHGASSRERRSIKRAYRAPQTSAATQSAPAPQ